MSNPLGAILVAAWFWKDLHCVELEFFYSKKHTVASGKQRREMKSLAQLGVSVNAIGVKR